MKRVVVIGLGIFGYNIVKELYKSGFDVIAIDKNKEAVQKVKNYASKAILADGADKEVLDMIGIYEEDVVIISFGEDLAAATLITLHLKQLKVKNIIVKAPNEEHQKILEMVGASDVIIPEKEMANKVVKSLASPNVLDSLQLSEDYVISELAPPNSFLGKSLAELQLRSKYQIEVIAVRDVTMPDRIHMIPGADFVLKDGEVLIVLGRERDIQKIK